MMNSLKRKRQRSVSRVREVLRFRVVLINHHMEFEMKTIFTANQAFVADEDGVTAIEYGLIAALIGVAMAGAATLLGEQIETTFTTVKDKLVAALAP